MNCAVICLPGWVAPSFVFLDELLQYLFTWMSCFVIWLPGWVFPSIDYLDELFRLDKVCHVAVVIHATHSKSSPIVESYFFSWATICPASMEVGISKRKQENKHAFDQECDQEKKKNRKKTSARLRKRPRKNDNGQEKKKETRSRPRILTSDTKNRLFASRFIFLKTLCI